MFNVLKNLIIQIKKNKKHSLSEIVALNLKIEKRNALLQNLSEQLSQLNADMQQNKAEEQKISLPDDVAHYVASHVTSNIRELEGSLHRLQAHASLNNSSINLDLAQQILRDLVPRLKHELTADGVLKLVALTFGLKIADLKSNKRARNLSEPRQICMYLLRKHLMMSLPEIGAFMGDRHHTTIL